MICYIVATSVVIVAAAVLAALWPGLTERFDRILAWFILVPALIILVALALGLAGWLTPAAMLGGHTLILMLAGVLWWRRRTPGGGDGRVPVLVPVPVPVPLPVLVPLPVPVRIRVRVRWGPIAQPWLWLLGMAGVAALGWMVYAGLLMPPFGWDALAYHMPPAVWWLQAGRIYPAPTQFTFGYGYPQGMSLLILWQLAFTATDHLVNIIQVPFILLGVLAAYGLAREAGVGRRWAWWAGAFFGLTPIVLEQAVVPYNDVSVAALTLAALYLILRFRRSGLSGFLWLAGVALGLILSIKANGFLVAAIVGLLACLPVRRPRALLSTIGQVIVGVGLPCLVLAGYWYIRNLVLYHNPLYPAAVKVMGHTLFPGPRTVQNLINVTPDQTTWQSFVMALREASHWYNYDSPNGGFGALFTMVGIASIVGAGLHAAVTRRWWVVIQVAAGMLLLMLQPFKYPRYVLFLPALGGVAFAYVLQRLAGRNGRRLLQAGAAGLMLATLAAVPYQPQLSAETFQQVRAEIAAGRPPSAATFGTARSVGFIQADPALNHPDNRIAYTEQAQVYPLMGRTRQNRIYYVPATTYGDWLARLKAAQTTFLIIGDDRAVEFYWVEQHPEDFVLWVRNWPFTIFVLRSDLPRNQLLINARGGAAL